MAIKNLYVAACLLLVSLHVGAYAPEFAEWSQGEMDAANTAAHTSLSEQEKKVFLYTNLARLDGKKFADTYVKKYYKTNPSVEPNYSSLLTDLSSVKNQPMLQYNAALCQSAAYHAQDMGRTGQTGHNSSDGTDCWARVDRYYTCQCHRAENCSYGCSEALDIVMQLLLDKNTPSLGHRKNILNSSMTEMGTAIAPHLQYGYNCVQDFGSNVPAQYANISATAVQSTRQAPQASKAERPRVKQRFYDFAGKSHISFAHAAFRYGISNGDHTILFGVASFRTRLFGFSLFDFEKTFIPSGVQSWSYSPSLRVYLPAAKCLAFSIYGGASVDITSLFPYVKKTYEYDSSNFFVSAYGGLDMTLYAGHFLPLDVFAEYRYPVSGNSTLPGQEQGFYFGVKLGLGKRL